MSLRKRLILSTVVVVAVALAVADVTAYVALRSFLVARAQQDVVDAAIATPRAFLEPNLDAKVVATILEDVNPNAAYAMYDASGVLLAQAAAYGNDKVALPPPVLRDPKTVPSIDLGRAKAPNATTATIVVPAASGGFDYVVTSVVAKSGAVLIVAFPLNEAAATLGQLAVIESLATLAVIVFVVIATTRLIGLALRPLAAIEDTAAGIAAGDLGRRIAVTDSGTEVGRLGLALNTMLGRIAAALAAREASEERLRRLVTDASHELRTPLTSIRGYAELFRRGADERPGDLARSMRGIESESERMAILVDDLLLLARLDEYEQLPANDVDVVPIVGAAVDAARAVEPDRPIKLEATRRALIRADETRIRQVVDNLLANVRVHTPKGAAASVTVRVGDERVILTVADTGPGLSESAQQRVFERFFRADPSRSRDSGGSGLGLAIVASIVRAYGGTVAVESALGRGTTIVIDWPAPAPGLEAIASP